MPKRFNTKIGPRDLEILSAIDRCPLTVQQLRTLSQTFSLPFHDESNLRRRLRLLEKSTLLKSWRYAIASNGASPQYFRLSRDGFRLLHGQDVALPRRRQFEEISHGHHHHTKSLSDLIVHICVHACKRGIVMRHFSRENTLRLQACGFTMYPDCAFQLVTPNSRGFNFVVELDNGTERVRTRQDVESIERKLRGYDAHQQQFAANDAGRYLVLFVTTRTDQRLQHILQLADMLVKNRQRTVFIGSDLDRLLNSDPITSAIYSDHRGLKRCLIPNGSSHANGNLASDPKQTVQIPFTENVVH